MQKLLDDDKMVFFEDDDRTTYDVKKAGEIDSLSDLGISDESINELLKFCTPINKLILKARIYYNLPGHRTEWDLELRNALDEQGYIRHDFDPRSFAVGRLYNEIYCQYAERMYIDQLEDFPSNESYEGFRNTTDEEFALIIKAVDDYLTQEEAQFIIVRYGLVDDGMAESFMSTCTLCDISVDEGERIKNSALRKLANYTDMPYVYQFNDEMLADYIENLYARLSYIHKDTIFEREARVQDELFKIESMNRLNVKSYMPVEELPLHRTIYRALKMASIYTVKDILELEKGGLSRVSGIDEWDILDIRRALRRIGIDINVS